MQWRSDSAPGAQRVAFPKRTSVTTRGSSSSTQHARQNVKIPRDGTAPRDARPHGPDSDHRGMKASEPVMSQRPVTVPPARAMHVKACCRAMADSPLARGERCRKDSPRTPRRYPRRATSSVGKRTLVRDPLRTMTTTISTIAGTDGTGPHCHHIRQDITPGRVPFFTVTRASIRYFHVQTADGGARALVIPCSTGRSSAHDHHHVGRAGGESTHDLNYPGAGSRTLIHCA